MSLRPHHSLLVTAITALLIVTADVSCSPYLGALRARDNAWRPFPPGARVRLSEIDGHFEARTWNSWNDGELCDGSRIAIEDKTVRAGNYSLLLQHDICNRAELVPKNPLHRNFHFGKEYWVAASFYLKNWDEDPAGWNTLTQFHTVPHGNDWSCVSGDNGLTIYTDRSNQLAVHAREIRNPLVEIPGSAAINDAAWTGPVPVNTWFDIVLHFRFSTGKDGFARVWKDRVLLVDVSGPNVHVLDTCGKPREPYTFLKIGSYKDSSNVSRKSIYIDEIYIGEGY